MKPTMFFDGGDPPFVNEAMLRLKLEEKRQRTQTALAALGAALVQLMILVFGVLCLPVLPVLSIFAFGYVFCAVLGGGLLALVLTRGKENDLL